MARKRIANKKKLIKTVVITSADADIEEYVKDKTFSVYVKSLIRKDMYTLDNKENVVMAVQQMLTELLETRENNKENKKEEVVEVLEVSDTQKTAIGNLRGLLTDLQSDT